MPKADQGMPKERRYQFVPRVLVFLEREGQVLLIKGAPTKRVWPNLYNGLGGHIERGESVLEAAQREVLEESGLAAERLWLCAVVTIDTEPDTGIVMWVFRGQAGEGELMESEEGGLEWVDLERLGELELVEDLPELLPRIFEMERGEGPLWGRYWYTDDQFRSEFSE